MLTRLSAMTRRFGRPGMATVTASRPIQVVVTPGSGHGAARRLARKLVRLLRRRGHELTVQSYGSLEALRQWAMTCEPDFSHVLCIGGDGTLSAAAHAAIRGEAPLVPVPAGFGNIFASVFGYPRRATQVAALIDAGYMRRVDVGIVGDGDAAELFLSHRSYGILEQIQNVAEHGRRQPRNRILRYLWYYGVAYRLVFRTRLAGFSVEIDGKEVARDAVLVTVANVETYRGFLPLTPAASPIDGLFDVAVIPRVSKAELARRFLWLLLRLPGRWRGLTLHRGRRVVVTTPRRREALTVRRRALRLVVPPAAVADRTRRTVD